MFLGGTRPGSFMWFRKVTVEAVELGNAHGWDHSQTIAQFQGGIEEYETNWVAMDVSKREQMPEKCCECTQQSLAPDKIYRLSEMEETEE